jgi:hypothetical protein
MTEPTGPISSETPPSKRKPGRGTIVAAWLFPVLAWAAATLYFGGALGKNCDDYSVNMRNVVTDALPSPLNPWMHFPYFIRPLHHVLVFGGMTLFPTADRGLHIFLACCHALACLAIWRLMREFTRTRLAPAAATLVFLVLPWHGEAVFWYSTISTSIGVAMFCWAALAAMRCCRDPAFNVLRLVQIALIAFLVPCFYEQSIAPAAALPLIGLAATPASWPWARRSGRAIAATAAAGLATISYVTLFVATAPKVARGGATSFVPRHRVAEKLHETIGSAKYNLIGDRAHDIFLGSLSLGRQVVATPKGLVIGSLLLPAAVLWAVWAIRKGGACDDCEPQPPSNPDRGQWRAAWLIPIGGVIFVASFLPIYVIDKQVVELRNLYVPLFGAALILGGLFDLVFTSAACASLLRSDRGFASILGRAVVAGTTITAVAFGAIGLIGFQQLYRNRSARDLREVAQLKELFPNPPPGTVFVPFRTRSKGAETNYALFDRHCPGVFQTPWSAPALLLRSYHRSDIGTTSSNPWAALPLDKPDERAVHWKTAFGFPLPLDPDGGVRIPWDSIVPFVTDARPDARVRLISEITVEMPDHRDLAIRPRLVEQVLATHPDLPTAIYRMRSGDADKRLDLIPLKFWEYADGSQIPFSSMWIWAGGEDGGSGIPPRDCAWLAAYYQRFASMSISMPPVERAEYLLMRATMAEFDLDPAKHEFAFVEELVVTMAAAPDKELAVLRLDPREIKRRRRWVPLIVTLPPRPPPAGDRIVVTIRHAKDGVVRLNLGDKTSPPADALQKAAILPVWITPGYEQAIPVESGGEPDGK